MTASERRHLRCLALGDSYTIGEGVPLRECWPNHLAARLQARGLLLGEPRIVAQTGWTTEELAAAIAAANLQPPYDLVTLLIGVNDQYRGCAVERYEAAFVQVVETAVHLGGADPGRVVVVSIPDWGGTPFAADRDAKAIAEALDRFNEVNRAAASEAGCRYVDVTDHSRRHAQSVVDDGLHPTGDVYAAWAKLIEPAATAALTLA